MNDNPEIPNKLLRIAATQTAFTLTLSKNQVRVLESIANGRSSTAAERWERLWVPCAKSLQTKGLLDHRHNPDFNGKDRRDKSALGDINDYYRLTRAGWLMFDLLAEAGMVEPITSRKLRRLVA